MQNGITLQARQAGLTTSTQGLRSAGRRGQRAELRERQTLLVPGYRCLDVPFRAPAVVGMTQDGKLVMPRAVRRALARQRGGAMGLVARATGSPDAEIAATGDAPVTEVPAADAGL